MTPDAAEPRHQDSGSAPSRPDRVWRPDPLSSGWRGPSRWRDGWPEPSQEDAPGTEPAARVEREQGNAGFMVSGYLISGMVVYGAVGALIGHLVHLSWVFPIGMLLGLGAGLALVVLRYGRS